jgi:hypothetical protein
MLLSRVSIPKVVQLVNPSDEAIITRSLLPSKFLFHPAFCLEQTFSSIHPYLMFVSLPDFLFASLARLD